MKLHEEPWKNSQTKQIIQAVSFRFETEKVATWDLDFWSNMKKSSSLHGQIIINSMRLPKSKL